MKNENVIKAFINNEKAKTTNLKTNGQTLTNYQTDIATKKEDGTIIINTTKYSKTTSIIQNKLKAIIKNFEEINNKQQGFKF